MPYRADRSFTFYFVRHGITAPNFSGLRCGGRDRARKVHHASDHDEEDDRSSRDDVPANHVQRKTGRGGEE